MPRAGQTVSFGGQGPTEPQEESWSSNAMSRTTPASASSASTGQMRPALRNASLSTVQTEDGQDELRSEQRRKMFTRKSTMELGDKSESAEEKRRRVKDLDDLLNILQRHAGGSFLRGWRQYFDPDGVLEVGFTYFCQALDRLRFRGDVRLLMGTDEDMNTFCLEEFNREAAVLIGRLKTWIKSEFNSTDQFFKACDKSSSGQVKPEQFVSTIVDRGFQADDPDPELEEKLGEVFCMCDVDNVESIKACHVLFLEADNKLRDELLARTRVLSMQEWRHKAAQEYLERITTHSDPSHRLAPRPWQAQTFEKLPHVVCQRRYDRKREETKRQLKAKAIFFDYVYHTFGNEIRFLRRLHNDSNIRGNKYIISQVQLRNHLGRAGQQMDNKDLWKALDRDDDLRVRIEEIAPARTRVMARFQLWAANCPRLRSCVAFWDCPETVAARNKRRPGPVQSTTKLKFSAAIEALKQLGWPQADDREERSSLLTSIDYSGCGFITKADLEWIDGWRGSEWLYADEDPEAWEELKAMLLQKYNHLLRAWRMLLDKDNSNKLSWVEFRDACKVIKFDGNVAGAWRHLDDDMSGFISMREYDSASADLLSSFKEWAESCFGSVTLCFKALDEDRSGSVTLTELKRACHKMNWSGDVRLLFQCLDADHVRDNTTGKRSVMLDEICFLDAWIPEPAVEEEVDLSPARPGTAPHQRSTQFFPGKDADARRPGTAPEGCAPGARGAPRGDGGARPSSQGSTRAIAQQQALQPPGYLRRVGINCTTPSWAHAEAGLPSRCASAPGCLRPRPLRDTSPDGAADASAPSRPTSRALFDSSKDAGSMFWESWAQQADQGSPGRGKPRPPWDSSMPESPKRTERSGRAALRGFPDALQPRKETGKATGPATAAEGAAALRGVIRSRQHLSGPHGRRRSKGAKPCSLHASDILQMSGSALKQL